MVNIYYEDLENVDKTFAPYIITALKEKKRLQLKVLQDIQTAYQKCYHNVARHIRKKEKKRRLKVINSALELVINKACGILAMDIKNIIYLSIMEASFIALSPLARIKLDLLIGMSKDGQKTRDKSLSKETSSSHSTPSITGEAEEDDAHLELLRSVQKDILAEAKLIAKSTMEKISYFNEVEFKISTRIWDLSDGNKELIKNIIKEGINMNEASIAPLLEKYVKNGKDKLIKDYPNLKKRLGNRFTKDTTYNAYRLINNEIAKVFFNTTLNDYRQNEYVSAVKWLLSNNRTKKYEKDCNCSDYAYQNIYGLGNGIYPPKCVPERPHVLCQCSLAPVSSRRLKNAMQKLEHIGNTPSEEWLVEARKIMQAEKKK